MAKNTADKNWVFFLATFPPRACGIATFTEDLVNAFSRQFSPRLEPKIIAMNADRINQFNYPRQVMFQIDQNRDEDYVDIAKRLNKMPQAKLVNIQHEFGIFGGSWGDKLLLFLKEINKPVILTFHTVLPQPKEELRNLVRALASPVSKVVVMTELSKRILIDAYGIEASQIAVIPHGIHPLQLTESSKAKPAFKLQGKTVLSTFGLLSKGKGIEYVIDALPPLIKRFPNLVYFIVGATHPSILLEEGESYRQTLTQKVYDLALQDNVKFYNKYLSLDELLEFLKATDVYLSTSLSPDQAVSGTLSYALGAGRPVISTAFAQAQEIITPDVGRLVEFRKPEQFTAALQELLKDPELLERLGRNAYFATRFMIWPNVALAYMKVFFQALPEHHWQRLYLPKVDLGHLNKMTDNFGFLQFSKLDEPDPQFGYTVDDNARALLLTSLYYQKYKNRSTLRLISTYVNFFKVTARPDGYFNNYVNYDQSFNSQANETESMEDPTGRALHALATTATQPNVPEQLKNDAKQLFLSSLRTKQLKFNHLRAIAFYIKALAEWMSKTGDTEVEPELIRYAEQLAEAYKKNSHGEWKWFEAQLTYSNAVLPEALALAFHAVKDPRPDWLQISRESMEFLISHTFKKEMYLPIGQKGWFKHNSERSIYDQQPEDPATMVLALNSLFKITGDPKYEQRMFQAFGWFLGDNLQAQVVYDAATGGCYDGLTEHGVNLNQGAESTVMYLLARLAVDPLF